MKSVLMATIFLLLCTTLTFANGNAAAALEKFKSLEGTWTTTDKEGHVRSMTYETVADGSAVLETFQMSDDMSKTMITMYHLNGDELMLTHYCMAKNQPRMKASFISDDLKEMNFEFLDATNLPNPNDGHMYKAHFRFAEPDTIWSEWTFRKNGEDAFSETEIFKRSK
jgi:hypothetical protein